MIRILEVKLPLQYCQWHYMKVAVAREYMLYLTLTKKIPSRTVKDHYEVKKLDMSCRTLPVHKL